MNQLLEIFATKPPLQGALEALRRGESFEMGGLWGSLYALVTATARAHLAQQPLLLVTPSIEEAEQACDDVETFLGSRPWLFPAWENLPGETPDLSSNVLEERLRSAMALVNPPGGQPPLVVAPIQAVLQRIPAPDVLRAAVRTLSAGVHLPMEELARELAGRGYERVPECRAAGEFSIRGGIFDMVLYGDSCGIRIEYDGDTVESLREIDPETYRSGPDRDSARLCLVDPREFSRLALKGPGRSESVLQVLGDAGVVVLKEPEEIAERIPKILELWQEHLPQEKLREVTPSWGTLQTLELSTLPVPEGPRRGNFRALSTQRFQGELANVFRELRTLCQECHEVRVFAANEAEIERFGELLEIQKAEDPAPWFSKVRTEVGHLEQGFHLPDLGLAFLPYHELLNRVRLRRPRPAALGTTRAIEHFLELERDDTVVHVAHGIGKYLGMERSSKDGQVQDFLVLEYQDHARLYVPATQIDAVQKYIGAGDRAPELSKLGGTAWQSRKTRVEAALEGLAKELLEVQAIRERQTGIAYPPDPAWQREFEASFPFQETVDQIEVSRIIAQDMLSPRPMDRLLCGDVGFGKTELAMRAAFRAAVHGKQVAVLVPTTILAQQHFQTFRERMAAFPLRIETLSRFRSGAEQRKVLEGLEKGTVDIVIGTHRLVSADVLFRDLGLVVIDEEQRFGVEHKERLKKLRAIADILTLTATPIPRTLHLSLLGIREISCLATAPSDRRAVLTRVIRKTPEVIREAILRELSRDGQVFYVHNRVTSIEEVADDLRRLVPEATFSVVHGQMEEDLLEERMLEFISGETDVLVTTTIIESGLDIPNANTLIVEDADQFGLADLHQLRGRVGRYKHQAHAYFLLPEERPVTREAAKRLRALEEFNQLGAGFKLAMRDLEIRGAGNILGREQHGHIASVGYDMYCRLLEAAVRKVKKQKLEVSVDTQVDLKVGAYLPDSLFADESQRLEVYRKLSKVVDEDGLQEAREEIRDRFGAIPEELERLLQVVRIRFLARRHGIVYLGHGEGAVVARWVDRERIERLRRRFKDRVRIVGEEAAHFVGTKREMRGFAVIGFLEKMLRQS